MAQAQVLSAKQIRNIFSLFDADINRGFSQAYKYKTLFACGIYTGLRISELISIRWSDVYTEDTVRQTLSVRRTKKKTVIYSNIPIALSLRRQLSDYRKWVNQDDAIEYPELMWLIPGKTPDKHIGRETATRMLANKFEQLGMDGYSTHSMRRTALTTLKRNGIDLETIRQISGHTSLSQLQAYLKTDPDDVRTAINKLKY